MDLDRGTLAKIDRRVLAALGDGETYRIVRVPVSEMTWSIWRRYCAALGMSMGRAIAGLISHELGTVVASDRTSRATFETELQEQLLKRSRDLDVREKLIDKRERGIRTSERQLRATTRPLQSVGSKKVGRNEPCPCGSGFKYKRCHGV